MEDPNKEDLQAQIEWVNKNMPDQAAPEIQLRQYFDKERRPIRLIVTVMPEQTTDVRVTWWTQGQGSERLEWNFNATLDPQTLPSRNCRMKSGPRSWCNGNSKWKARRTCSLGRKI